MYLWIEHFFIMHYIKCLKEFLMHKVSIIIEFFKIDSFSRKISRRNLKTLATYQRSLKLSLTERVSTLLSLRGDRSLARFRSRGVFLEEKLHLGADVRPVGQLGFKFSPKDKKL